MLLAYLRGLNTPRIVLWCYLIWYLAMAGFYFDPAPAIWLTALGLSAIIGYSIVLSARAAKVPQKMDRWQLFRTYFTPFCVSSFAALVKGKGFFLVFSPVLAENALAAGGCLVFTLAVLGLRVSHRA